MRRSARAVAGMVVLAAAASLARAQCDPQRLPVDVRFDQQPVALSVYNGELVAGGSFTRIGAASIARIARWDGSVWAKYGSGLSGPPNTLGEFQGELIAGGSFQGGLAAWNGTSWRTLGGGTSGPSGGTVYSLFNRGDELIVGGLFSSAGGVPANRVAAWNGTSWRAFGDGFDRSVWAFAVYNDELIAGGRFTTSGGRPVKCIARWDGAQWHQLGAGVDGDVLALMVFNGELVAAGNFWTAAGQTVNCLARWDGVSWKPLGHGLLSRPGYEFLSYISGLTIYRGDLYAAGIFEFSGTVPMEGIARWDGTQWHAVQGSIWNSRALAVYRHELISTESASTTAGAGWARWSCPPCIADVDDDGLVDFTDYLAFLDLYRAGGPGADVTGDGVVDRSDWLLFLETYSTGCS